MTVIILLPHPFLSCSYRMDDPSILTPSTATSTVSLTTLDTPLMRTEAEFLDQAELACSAFQQFAAIQDFKNADDLKCSASNKLIKVIVSSFSFIIHLTICFPFSSHLTASSNPSIIHSSSSFLLPSSTRFLLSTRNIYSSPSWTTLAKLTGSGAVLMIISAFSSFLFRLNKPIWTLTTLRTWMMTLRFS